MTNFDRALAVLDAARRPGEIRSIHPYDAVEALTNEGLLAPDLPEPEPANDGALTWAAGNVWVEDDEDIVYTEFPRRWSMLSPHGARELGLALLAAAQYSRGEA